MFLNRRIRSFFLLLLLGLLIVPIAQAGPLYIVTARGTVSPDQPFYQSYDTRGIFGAPGASLVGASFVMKQYWDSDYGTRTTTGLRDSLGGAALVAVQVELNGIGLTITRGSVVYSDGLLEIDTLSLSPLITGLKAYSRGETTGGIYFETGIELVPSGLSPGAGIDPPPVSLDNGFKYSSNYPDLATVHFSLSTLDDIIHPYLKFGALTYLDGPSLTISETRVPEPPMLALFIAGLVCFGALRRRIRTA